MQISSKKLLRQELIGTNIEIIDSKNKDLIGLKGKIINETKNMFMINNHKIKKIPKDKVIISIEMNKNKIKIPGKYFIGRPEDRLKK